jgi:hypothetical protein
MQKRTIIRLCILGNVIALGVAIMLTVGSSSQSTWVAFGWSDKLFVLSVPINTWYKYVVVLAVFGFMSFSKVIDEASATPILWFALYDQSKVVYDISRFEVCVYSWLIFVTSRLRDLLLILVSISQIDIGLFCILSALFALIIMSLVLTHKKKFEKSMISNTYIPQVDDEMPLNDQQIVQESDEGDTTK